MKNFYKKFIKKALKEKEIKKGGGTERKDNSGNARKTKNDPKGYI